MNTPQDPSEAEGPKLHVDEDWKEQVQREKEQAAAQAAAAQSKPSEATPPEVKESSPRASAEAPEPPSPSVSRDEAAESDSGAPQVEASFTMLVTLLATQAMAAMGQMPGPQGEKLPVDRNIAKHFIDTLGVLEEKTRGNLTDDEAQLLSETLHHLRMSFVATGS